MNSISLKEQRPPLVRAEDLTPLRGMFLSYVNVSCQLASMRDRGLRMLGGCCRGGGHGDEEQFDS